jgi:hypothetical protein
MMKTNKNEDQIEDEEKSERGPEERRSINYCVIICIRAYENS